MTTDSLTFGQFAQDFFSENCPRMRQFKQLGKEFAPRYINEQRRVLTCFILTDKVLYNTPVLSMKRFHVQRFIDKTINNYGITRKSKGILSLLKIILKELFYLEYIDRDIAAGLRSIVYKEKEKGILSLQEIKEFLNPKLFDSLTERAFFTTALLCGLRKSEARALFWSDIDFDNDVITVQRAWKDGKTLGLPKNGKARTTWAPKLVKTLLLEYKRLNCSSGDLIFTVSESWVQRHFKQLMERMGIDCKAAILSFTV